MFYLKCSVTYIFTILNIITERYHINHLYHLYFVIDIVFSSHISFFFVIPPSFHKYMIPIYTYFYFKTCVSKILKSKKKNLKKITWLLKIYFL